MKAPAFQFYPGDWQRNANLRRCTHAQRGIWLDVMCLMHDSEEYGVLRWPLAEIARAVGAKLADLQALVAREVLKGADAGEAVDPFVFTPRHAGKDGEPVVLIPAQHGPLWYSSRMVRDEYVRSKRGSGTRFGEDKPPPTRTPTHRIGVGIGDGPAVCSLQSASAETKPSMSGTPDLVLQVQEKAEKPKSGLEAQARELLDFLNTAAGTRFQPVEANLKLARARLKEYDLPTLKRMVAMKCEQWLETDSAMYLRPETLFGATKCAQYVGQLPPTPPEKAHG